MQCNQRRAREQDLKQIILLLAEDELGQTREDTSESINPSYLKAFEHIQQDPNQYLMVVEKANCIVGTCHLTLMPSLTSQGATRLQIEAVRVHHQHRGNGIGQWMIESAIQWGENLGASIIQLSCNKKRKDALDFYKNRGFETSHEGMKLYLDKT